MPKRPCETDSHGAYENFGLERAIPVVMGRATQQRFADFQTVLFGQGRLHPKCIYQSNCLLYCPTPILAATIASPKHSARDNLMALIKWVVALLLSVWMSITTAVHFLLIM